MQAKQEEKSLKHWPRVNMGWLASALGAPEKKVEVFSRQTKKLSQEIVFEEDAMRVFYGSSIGFKVTEKFLTQKWLSDWYGAYNDSAASRHKIEHFAETLQIDLAEAEKDISEYNSFNEFFARRLKQDARPIANGEDTVASPGDGRLLVFPKIKDDTIAYVKWAPIKLIDLFHNNEELLEKYSGGDAAILRLCPADYHRFHFPVAGTVGVTKTIPGELHSVSPFALERKLPVFCLNKRTVCEVSSPQFGNVLLMEVGALFVGSIVQTYRAGTIVKKGEEKGYFKFGGSTAIFFFQKDKIRFDDDLVAQSKEGIETIVKMGERIAKAQS